MDGLHLLIIVGFVHCSLFFIDVMFKSCCHLPYLYFLKNTGFEVQLLRIKWFTTVLNRKIIKWGMGRSRFWSAWFNAGVIISILLLPIALVIILKMTFNIWAAGPSLDGSNSDISLEPMLPGINMPFSDIGYYTVAIAICTIVHELGHAIAAAREDVQLYGLGLVIIILVPVAFVQICSDQLSLLPLRNQLRVACAGVWHNVILATLAATFLMISPWLWAPLYTVGSGIYVKTILPNSPLMGPSGLLEQNVIYKLNDCPVERSDDWYYCILNSVQQPPPGYCVKQSFVQEYDESVPSRQKTNGAINCCTPDSEANGNLCFEYIEGPQSAPLHLPPHSCLPARAMINQSQNYCQASHECLSPDTHCMKPSLDNVTKIIELRRKTDKDVLFIGHPADIYRTVDISDWVPKYSFVYPKLPETLALLCTHITVFSAGLAVLNILPCFFLDGQFIINILALYLFDSKIQNQNLRLVLTLSIISIGTLLLSINLMYSLVNKLL